ncbi:MAG: hypothetical protein V9E89_04230 [Ilumatobacteraceae bacterium]
MSGDRPDNDRGSGEVLGLVLFFPVMIGLALMILWLGRKVDAGAQVRAASEAAAQAAARQRTPAAGLRAAQQTAQLTLAKGTCAGAASVSVSAASWAPGGSVTVTVSCRPPAADLSLLAPQPRTMRATATATIDAYRAAGRR